MLNGGNDVLIPRAAAQIAFEAVPDLLFRRIRIPAQELARRQDHSGCAEAALQAVFVPESPLHGVEASIRGQPFDRGDLDSIGLNRQQRAGFHRLVVHQHRARSTDTRLAPYVSSGETKDVPEVVHEQQSRFDSALVLLAVDFDANGCFQGSPTSRGFRGDLP
jgi:hypothetical protein